MDCTIVTRSMYPKLTAMAHALAMDLGFKFRSIFNTSMSESGTYLERAIYESDTKYVINLDEDAFIYNIARLLKLLNFMDQYGFGFCGVPDGGVISHRLHNPVVPNPFFNIFNCDILKQFPPIYVPRDNDDKDIGLYDSDLDQFIPYYLINCDIDYQCDNFQWQYYHLFFNWLRKGVKPLYLNATMGDDNITSVVQDHTGSDIIHHTWFARHYYKPDDVGFVHKTRIDCIYERSLYTRHFDIGIVVPCHNVSETIKQQFITHLESLDISLKYIVEFVDEELDIGSKFNLGKSRNCGINKLNQLCDVIVCTDASLLVPIGLLEFTYRKCIQINGCVLSGVDWNALPSSRWVEIGGWNEDIYGYDYDDHELYSRLASDDIDAVFTNSFPVVRNSSSNKNCI